MDDSYANGDFPAFNLTPPVVPPETSALAALLAPPVVEPANDKNVFVSFQDCRTVSASDKETVFELSFTVCISPKVENSTFATTAMYPDGTKTTVVTRRVVVNNTSLGREAEDAIANKKTVYVESKQSKDKQSAVAKRMRELAGIPHKGNFV